MNRHCTVNFDELGSGVKRDLIEFEQANHTLPARTLLHVLEAYLRWNGIIGYTAQILNIIEATEEHSE